jgi:O-antigen ligase
VKEPFRKGEGCGVAVTASEQRTRERWVAIVPVVVIAAAVVFPRAAASFYVAAGALAAIALWRTQGGAARPVLSWPPVFVSLLALCVWAALSALWSPAPASAIGKSLYLVVLMAATCAIFAWGRAASDVSLRALAFGTLASGLVGLVVIAIELLSDQLLARSVLTQFPFLMSRVHKHITVVNGVAAGITEADLNRRTAVVTLLLWPCVLALPLVVRERRHRLIALAAGLLTLALVLVLSGHQSSQVALTAGAIAFALALWSARAALRTIAVAWSIAVLLAVPIVFTAHEAGLQNASWLFNSARHRVVIWGTTAQEIAKSPFLGVGADASSTIKQNWEESGYVPRVDGFVATGRHAHNMYLQIWYELGIPGALLLLASGLAALWSVVRLRPDLQPYAIAQFATFAGMTAFSYSMWQMWFQATIAMGLAAFLIAGELIERSRTQPRRF